ncbi:hypothetical protein QYM36_018533 [Artemia franciscana]|uniref:Uncharacterized protein n=1 Tax=Artemia franciscana TaxID=6661 RepID=A0AA88H281_ARTSF|nr:hypothetical protein QYM36_018533 [Artemia franciscana]
MSVLGLNPGTFPKIRVTSFIVEKEKKGQELLAECTASSYAMEEVEDALEVHAKKFSQVRLDACGIITNEDKEPPDYPTALAEMPVTEATEHGRLGSLSNVSDKSEAAAVTPMVPSLAYHPGRKRAKSGEEKVTRDMQKHQFIDSTPCERLCQKQGKELTRENCFTVWKKP